MWSDGYWELNDDGTELTLTPKNQSENGNIGVAAGKARHSRVKTAFSPFR